MHMAKERRDLAMIRLTAHQNGLKRQYGKTVRKRELNIGDFVLRKVVGSKKEQCMANWEPIGRAYIMFCL